MDVGQTITDLIRLPFICFGWIVVGAIAGIIAHNVMKSRASLIVDIVVGLLGAVIGGFILNLFGIVRTEGGIGGVIVSLIVATIGGVILIALWRLVRGRSVT